MAEDDAVSRFAIRSLLQKSGHRPVCVGSGAQALAAMQLHPFHCLFTDIRMPGMDGLELARSIRNNAFPSAPPSAETKALVREVFPGEEAAPPPDPGIFIVAVSAHAMAGDKERFLRQGFNFYISKPIVMEELCSTLDRVTAALAKQQGKTGRLDGAQKSPSSTP